MGGAWAGLPKHCFGNAIMNCVWEGRTYVEGYMLMPLVLDTLPGLALVAAEPELGLAIHHAWNGPQLHDSTLENGALAHLGVEFSVERADDCTWEGNATVLEDSHRGWPLLREPWQGEHHDWPASAWRPSVPATKKPFSAWRKRKLHREISMPKEILRDFWRGDESQQFV